MQLTPSAVIPKGKNWIYEAKYDGFRSLLQWDDKGPLLWSRNGNRFNDQFPEIIDFCKSLEEQIKPYLPLIFNGKIVRLEQIFAVIFTSVQINGPNTLVTKMP